MPTGLHAFSGAAAPSLPGLLPDFISGPQLTTLPLVCQQGCTHSRGPLPHHYQGRCPIITRAAAHHALVGLPTGLHSLWGRCPNITRAPARLYLRAAAHHAPVGSPAGMHALSWSTAPSLLGLQPDFSQSHSPLCSCGCAIRASPHQACLSQGRSPPGLVWPILRFGYFVGPLPYHGYSPTQSQCCSLPGSRSGRGLSTMTRACLYLSVLARGLDPGTTVRRQGQAHCLHCRPTTTRSV